MNNSGSVMDFRDKQESNVVTKTFVVDDTGAPNDDDMTYIEDDNAELLKNIYNAETQLDTWHDNQCGSAPHNSRKVMIFKIIYTRGLFLRIVTM